MICAMSVSLAPPPLPTTSVRTDEQANPEGILEVAVAEAVKVDAGLCVLLRLDVMLKLGLPVWVPVRLELGVPVWLAV